jgi:hypothetical protein
VRIAATPINGQAASALALAFVLSSSVPTSVGAQTAGSSASQAPPRMAAAQATQPGNAANQGGTERREDVEVSVFSGVSIDSFAARELQDYINKDASGDAREQLIAGFDFAYRIAGRKNSTRQLWIYGETVHGVRSGDANCGGENADTEVCEVAELDRESPEDIENPLAIFRKATTFEAFMGLRAEFLTLRQDSASAAAKLYVKGQLGLLTVAGRGGDAVDIHHAALGLILTHGDLAGSYVEAGYGKNALFHVHPSRYKIDGFLTYGKEDATIKPFAQVVIDTDFGRGAESIQTYFGLDIDIARVFKFGSD